MKHYEYLVSSPATGEREIVLGMDRACDVAWDMAKDSENYVFVEDFLGHTVLEYE